MEVPLVARKAVGAIVGLHGMTWSGDGRLSKSNVIALPSSSLRHERSGSRMRVLLMEEKR
jgi:hypothetical protein